jgi:hypothetical protein
LLLVSHNSRFQAGRSPGISQESAAPYVLLLQELLELAASRILTNGAEQFC